MDTVLSQIFLYLASIYMINGILINIFRRLKLADFIAHILTGIVFSLLLLGWGEFFGNAGTAPFNHNGQLDLFFRQSQLNRNAPDSDTLNLVLSPDSAAMPLRPGEDDRSNALPPEIAPANDAGAHFMLLIKFMITVGLLLFLMQLGLNFDPRFFRMKKEENTWRQVGIFAALTALIVGLSSYFLVLERDLLLAGLTVIAFLSIHIGAVLSYNFPVSARMQRPFIFLIQLAILLDIIVIGIYSALEIYVKYQNFTIFKHGIHGIYLLILLLFIFPIIFSKATVATFKTLSKWMGEYTLLLKLGILFFFFYAGFQAELSVLLLGLWAGLLFNALMDISEFEFRQKFFAGASFLYILPFVEVGRSLFFDAFYQREFWIHLGVFIGALVLVSLVMGFLQRGERQYPLVISAGTFPRGELTVLIIWLFKEIGWIPLTVFTLLVVVVIVTNLIGTVMGKILFIRPLRRQMRT